MGGCMGSNAPQAPPDAQAQSHKIDEALKLDKKRRDTKIKLLLLGSGESGKCTLVKQVTLLLPGDVNLLFSR